MGSLVLDASEEKPIVGLRRLAQRSWASGDLFRRGCPDDRSVRHSKCTMICWHSIPNRPKKRKKAAPMLIYTPGTNAELPVCLCFDALRFVDSDREEIPTLLIILILGGTSYVPERYYFLSQ